MVAARAAAQDAGTPDAGDAAASPAPDPAPDPRTRQIHALVAGTLDVTLSPQSLFDVPLGDEAAVQIEATRVRTLLRALEESASAQPAASGSATRAAVEATDGGSQQAALEPVDPGLWSRRLELDRARLEFYALPRERRQEVLRAHEARQEAARPRETDDERRAREAEEERAKVLAAARAARSEAERLVGEEVARLIGLEDGVRAVRERLRAQRDDIVRRRDTILGWQRRVRDARAAEAVEADATYDALRRTLRASRDDLATSLDRLEDEHSDVPPLGPNPLMDVPPDVPADAAHERRSAVERSIKEARQEELAVREELAAALLDEINTLNVERLGLLPRLSTEKRDAVTGFTSAGWDQAGSEARQLSLILRYHRHIARTFVRTLQNDGARAVSPWRTAAVLLPLLLAVIAFVWGRRKTPSLLQSADSRLEAADRARRRTSPGAARRLVRLVLSTHRPLEWLLFFMIALSLLPSGARSLLEVQLVTSVIYWTVVGAVVVNVTNALAAGSGAGVMPAEDDSAGELRLRSLRLVGRTVVLFALILVLSARLVGHGTIYRWVFSTCWFAALPVFLLIVRWWRGRVFERLGRVRKKTPLQAWILANRSGWKSFLAATIGALQLFMTGTVKLVRGWLSAFDLARRVHAYLFKREVERMGEHAGDELTPLPEREQLALHPEQPAERWISCPNDGVLERLIQRASERRGGLVALVGARGMGKSSLLRALAAGLVEGAVMVPCDARTSLGELRGNPRITGDQEAGGRSSPLAALLDDAHLLIHPRIGGLATFDAILAFARDHSKDTTWVLTFDVPLWQLLRRARDARPIFDEIHHLAPWTEEQIGELLAERCERARISPAYDDLLERLPPGADEIDRQDALRAKRAGYERMLWDHVSGNPALALEVWRSSLALDTSGVVHVRPLQVPDVATLEKLPDSSLFILRAVLQMAPTTAEAVAQATRLRREEVLQDLRFGRTHGFFEEQSGGIRVAWSWLRPVTRVLERRHLLVTS